MATRSRSKPHPHAALPGANGASLISDARLVELYAAMLKCRMLRERARRLAAPARLRAPAACSEAVAAATIVGLLPEDTVIAPAPHLFAALLKSVPLADILRPLCAGRRASPAAVAGQACIARGVLAAPAAAPARRAHVAGALAAGAAFAGKIGSRRDVAVVFYGDDGSGLSWDEFYDYAAAQSLPLIFVRQAGRPYQPRARAGRGKSGRQSTRPQPGALPIIPVDSNDAIAVYRVAHEAIAHARRGSGPTLIDCVPLRMAGEHKRDSDCIARMERYLAAKGMRPERVKAALAAKFARALDAAVAAPGRSPHSRRGTSRPNRKSRA